MLATSTLCSLSVLVPMKCCQVKVSPTGILRLIRVNNLPLTCWTLSCEITRSKLCIG